METQCKQRVQQEAIASILKGINRYNPDNLRTLEPYVNQQASENTYDIKANLAILKLYQFNPTMFQMEVASKILLKTLMSLPSSDFTLCKALIDQAHQDQPELGRVIFLQQLLETCEFAVFWKEVEATPELVEEIVGFEEAIRNYICYIVSITFQRIQYNQLLSKLGEISEAEFEKLIEKNNWKKMNDGILFVANQEEKVKTRNIVEKVNFSKVRTILKSSAQHKQLQN